jgi:UDP-N-acetylmuramate dehydrogenase
MATGFPRKVLVNIPFENVCNGRLFQANAYFYAMPEIRSQVDLRDLNTFGIRAACDYFTEIGSQEDFRKLTAENVYRDHRKLVLGGGSNLLFRKDFEGIVIRNKIPGIEIISETPDDALVRAGAGVVWHDLVMWTLDKWLGGIENLSLIPGFVGAGPMQNIGAYGVELKDVFHSLDALDMTTGEKRVFDSGDCGFGYRESVFKRNYRDKYLIASVTLRLRKNAKVNTSYGAISQELAAMKITHPTIRDVSKAVIGIRQSKLPDPAVTGNAGSFFKNPEVSEATFKSLKDRFAGIVAYPLDGGGFKLAAGWLIEQCGLKGYEIDGAAVHTKQALVLVNKSGNCTGDAVYRLSEHVLETVKDKFGVTLEREVNIIG